MPRTAASDGCSFSSPGAADPSSTVGRACDSPLRAAVAVIGVSTEVAPEPQLEAAASVCSLSPLRVQERLSSPSPGPSLVSPC